MANLFESSFNIKVGNAQVHRTFAYYDVHFVSSRRIVYDRSTSIARELWKVFERYYKYLTSMDSYKSGAYCEHSEVFTLGTRNTSPEPTPFRLAMNVDIPVNYRCDSHPRIHCVLASLLNSIHIFDSETAVKLHH